ncbi:hypothetical protein ACIRD3_15580 [Kitasatospora sp. NPDC093550]|uniref:hypothetical protein n=1 Tax=Kitasatospora sp. NPDC093550 TaxID=3364089 RepID=UPI0037F8D08C
MARLRPQYVTWPRPAIHLADTPNPKCAECVGVGRVWTEYQSPFDTSEHAGSEIVHCGCWRFGRTRRLLTIPRWIARRWLGWTEPGYSTEPPF